MTERLSAWLARSLHDLLAWCRGDTLSHRWLRHQDRLEERIDFHGVAWHWPANETADIGSDATTRQTKRRG